MKKILFTLVVVTVVFLAACVSWAQEKKLPLTAEGEYFSIYAADDVDINDVLLKLNFNYFLGFETLVPQADEPVSSILAKTLDAIYLEVSDILGINIYSFHGQMRIFSSQAALNEEFQSIFHEDFLEGAFYYHPRNTIYISSSDITIGMLGHEIAHAIMSHYFVVPPPPKMQEVLSGYVEYNLRKSLGTL